jgi:hypothetical protein
MHDLAFIFAGFAVGLIVGFGIKPDLAIGTDLLFAAFTKMGSIPAALVRLTSVGASAMGSLPGIWLGSQLVHKPRPHHSLPYVFAAGLRRRQTDHDLTRLK